MVHKYHKPNPSIEKFIRTVITIEHKKEVCDQKLPLFTNEMPALLCKIILNTKSGVSVVKQFVLFGRSVSDDYLFVNDNEVIVLYLFKPFMLTTIFDITAIEIKDKQLNIHDWNPKKSYALNLQLIHCTDLSQLISVLDNFIIKQTELNRKECKAVKYSTDEMMIDQSNEVLGKILDELKMNERTFQRIFK